MNCWFCDQPLGEKASYCENWPCRSYGVTYVFFETHTSKEMMKTLYKVQLKVPLWNSEYKVREYIIDYRVSYQEMTIQERITPPFDPDNESVSIAFSFKHVLSIPYKTPIITPQNFLTKLPMLLTFS